MNNICPGCGAGYNVTPQHVGRQLACKKCGAMLLVKADGLHLAEAEPIGESAPPPMEEEDYASERAFRRAPRAPRYDDAAGTAVMDFLTFRRMIVPIIIQIIFWLLVALCLVAAVVVLANAAGPLEILGSILALILGPVAARVTCELMMVTFRINETLTDIRNMMKELKK